MLPLDCIPSAFVTLVRGDPCLLCHVTAPGLYSNRALGSFLVVHLILHKDGLGLLATSLSVLLFEEELLVSAVLDILLLCR